MKVKANLNNYVYVKLTPFGIAILEKRNRTIFHDGLAKYRPEIEIDKNGYTKFQLWEFMQIFGKYSYCGITDMPYETDVIIDAAEPWEM